MRIIKNIAKKLRRRNRKGNGDGRKVSSTMTAAERLIASNWGLSFKKTVAVGAGSARRRKREVAKLKANESIPSGLKVTRQQIRANARRSGHARPATLQTDRRGAGIPQVGTRA